MIRKILVLFGTSIFLQVLLVSCCGPIFGGKSSDDRSSYWALTGIESTLVSDIDLLMSISDLDSIYMDTLFIKVDLQGLNVASIFDINSWGTMQSAKACSEPIPGKFLKSPVRSITIESDQEWKNLPPGLDLSDFAVISSPYKYYDWSFKEFIDFLNDPTVSITQMETYVIKMYSKPDNNFYHRFTIKIESEDSQIISSQTQQIKWQ